MTIAFLFPGQGSQAVGMGKALADNFAAARNVFDAVDEFYRKFYFRPKPILRIVRDMMKDSDVRRRRLREGKEFFHYLRKRREGASETAAV